MPWEIVQKSIFLNPTLMQTLNSTLMMINCNFKIALPPNSPHYRPQYKTQRNLIIIPTMPLKLNPPVSPRFFCTDYLNGAENFSILVDGHTNFI